MKSTSCGVALKDEKILDSWKKISQYLGRDIRTCYRWEKELGLPIHRIDNSSPRSKVFAYPSEIDQWLQEKANHKELEKRFFLRNRLILPGLVTALALLSTVLIILYFSRMKPFSPKSEGLSLAVFPFENQNLSDYEKYFAEGITNEIIRNFEKINNLRVISSSSFAQYSDALKNTKYLKEKLKADYFLKGKIRKDEKAIGLSIFLIRAKDEKNIWNTEYHGQLGDLFSIRDQICLKICELLNIGRSQEAFLAAKDSRFYNPQAFDAYLKGSHILNSFSGESKDPWKLYHQGKYFWGRCTREANELAISLFSKAIEIDESFALPYIGLAYCYSNYINRNWDSNPKWLNRAEDLLKKAKILARDPPPEYYSALIEIYLLQELCFNRETEKMASALVEEGVKKFSSHPLLNSIVGYYYLLKFGKEGNETDFDKAFEYKERSFWLDPYALSNIVYADLLMLKKEFYKAIDVCLILEKDDPSLMARFRLAEIYYYLGDLDKSKAIFEQFVSPLNYRIPSLFYLGMIASQRGDSEQARKILNNIQTLSPREYKFLLELLKLASIHLGLGEKGKGFKCLETFCNSEFGRKELFLYHKYIDLDRNFDRYREEAKFKKIINAKESL